MTSTTGARAALIARRHAGAIPMVRMACAVLLLTLTMSACDRAAPSRAAARANSRAPGTGTFFHATPAVNVAGINPGIHPEVLLGVRRNPYANDPAAAAEGRQLFVRYNCAGCHGGRAGGGMGPSLRDSLWIYGNSDTQLLSTILEGRSAGMPAWAPRIPEQQVWKLISYIRKLGTAQEPDPPPPQAHPLQQPPQKGVPDSVPAGGR
jgi:cytochrome c oxidase cbb3-type subunit III